MANPVIESSKRLEAVFSALVEKGHLPEDAEKQLIDLQGNEPDLLTADEVRADDIIFLRRG